MLGASPPPSEPKRKSENVRFSQVDRIRSDGGSAYVLGRLWSHRVGGAMKPCSCDRTLKFCPVLKRMKRELAALYYDAGVSVPAIAERLQISGNSVLNYARLYKVKKPRRKSLTRF